MTLVVAINGSPGMEKGCTQWVLAPFGEGIAESWAEVEPVYASRLKIKPCNCGTMHCWGSAPGVRCHEDDMTGLIARLKGRISRCSLRPYISLCRGICRTCSTASAR